MSSGLTTSDVVAGIGWAQDPQTGQGSPAPRPLGELGCHPGQPPLTQVHESLARIQQQPVRRISLPLKGFEVDGRAVLVGQELLDPGQALVPCFERRDLGQRSATPRPETSRRRLGGASVSVR